mmetsp:Transcript_18283/g.69239  ORF Transcript_18283/g.69239 Transcript_18283/m.69239 type:complete len:399 (+) Transcript_18283:1513-2709(+)
MHLEKQLLGGAVADGGHGHVLEGLEASEAGVNVQSVLAEEVGVGHDLHRGDVAERAVEGDGHAPELAGLEGRDGHGLEAVGDAHAVHGVVSEHVVGEGLEHGLDLAGRGRGQVKVGGVVPVAGVRVGVGDGHKRVDGGAAELAAHVHVLNLAGLREALVVLGTSGHSGEGVVTAGAFARAAVEAGEAGVALAAHVLGRLPEAVPLDVLREGLRHGAADAVAGAVVGAHGPVAGGAAEAGEAAALTAGAVAQPHAGALGHEVALVLADGHGQGSHLIGSAVQLGRVALPEALGAEVGVERGPGKDARGLHGRRVVGATAVELVVVGQITLGEVDEGRGEGAHAQAAVGAGEALVALAEVVVRGALAVARASVGAVGRHSHEAGGRHHGGESELHGSQLR